MTDGVAFPIPEEEGQRTIKFEVVLDFDKMYESVIEKHWGWMGERPESFEEYCCMAVSSQLFDHIRWNEFHFSKALDVVISHLEEAGRERAQEVVLQNEESPYPHYGKNSDGTHSTPEDYYQRVLKIQIDVLADREAKRIHDEMLENSCAEEPTEPYDR